MKYRIANLQACDLYNVEEGELVPSGLSLKYTDKKGKQNNDKKFYTGMLNDSMLNDMLTKIMSRGDVVTKATFGSKDIKYTNQVIQLKFEYSIKDNGKTILNRDNLRRKLYKEGFTIDDIHYVRWMRSSGSARVGTCLFINEVLLHSMDLRSNAKVNTKQNIDLASFEAYRSLMLSSNIDYIEIKPENILVINDYESVFEDNCNVTTLYRGNLYTKQKKVEVKNSIWDGQSLIDKSIMGEYDNKGMLLLRNVMFKSCCFNCNIQQWFEDNEVTEVTDMFGQTHPAKDIKLITTPSSIKYNKFGSDNWFEEWCSMINKQFGIVKYEKPTKHEKGTMVRTHYQLMNTINLTREELKEVMKPSIDRINEVVSDADQMLDYCLNYVNQDSLSIQTKKELIVKLLTINPNIANTSFYSQLVEKIKTDMRGDIKKGKLLINGNYSTLCGNPIEMLQSAIGKFTGESIIKKENVVSTRFEDNSELLVCRSPHITMGNIYLPTNSHNEIVLKYMNFTDEIIAINSINENTLQRLQGCDFDSDSSLVTDNVILINAARKYYNKFNIPYNAVESKKESKEYIPENLAELDHKTSVNLIGQIVNLSQVLNSIYWDKFSSPLEAGETKKQRAEELRGIYKDICTLSVMSGLEIDKAKKFFDMDAEKELKRIRNKYDAHAFPKFFEYIDKVKGRKQGRKYKEYYSTMNMLYREIKFKRLEKSKTEGNIVDYIVGITDKRNANKEQAQQIIDACMIRVNANKEISKDNGYDLKNIADNDFYSAMKIPCKKKISIATIKYCIKYFQKERAYNALTEYMLLGLLKEKQEVVIKIFTPKEKIHTQEKLSN